MQQERGLALASDLGVDPEVCREILDAFPPHYSWEHLQRLVLANKAHVLTLVRADAHPRLIIESLMGSGFC